MKFEVFKAGENLNGPGMVEYETLSDEELMVRASGNDMRAFSVLYKRHYPKVALYFYYWLGRRSDSEELAQEVFLRIYRLRSSYKPSAKFTTYLYTVARRILLNHLRAWRGKPVETIGDRQFKAEENVEQVSQNREELQKVMEALSYLPTRQKQALILTQLHGLSYNETAQVLGVSINALKSLLNRARRNLIERLGK